MPVLDTLKTIVVGSTSQTIQNLVQLGVVAVGVVTHTWMVEALAFVDSQSDTT